jgi:hypothetical protein
MDRTTLKQIVQQLKSIVDVLESEVYSDPESYKTSADLDKLPGFKATYSTTNDDDGIPD